MLHQSEAAGQLAYTEELSQLLQTQTQTPTVSGDHTGLGADMEEDPAGMDYGDAQMPDFLLNADSNEDPEDDYVVMTSGICSCQSVSDVCRFRSQSVQIKIAVEVTISCIIGRQRFRRIIRQIYKCK